MLGNPFSQPFRTRQASLQPRRGKVRWAVRTSDHLHRLPSKPIASQKGHPSVRFPGPPVRRIRISRLQRKCRAISQLEPPPETLPDLRLMTPAKKRSVLRWIGIGLGILLAVLGFICAISPHYSDAELLALAAGKLREHRPPRSRYVILIDYRRPVFLERLYLVDMEKNQVALRSKVGHALRSGFLFASRFSNVEGSRRSCPGSFLTAEAYHGRFGHCMRLTGLEAGINDLAAKRSILFHKNFIPILMYSDGCFATPSRINEQLIEKTRNGSLVVVIR